jgi:hypothetical protein
VSDGIQVRFDILETGERLLDDIDRRQRTVTKAGAQFLHTEKTDVLIRTGPRIIHLDSPFVRRVVASLFL